MLKKLKIIIKNKKTFLIDEETGLLADASSYEKAFEILKKKTDEYKELVKKSGFAPMLFQLESNSKATSSYFKKWVIAFFFISVISIPVS